MPSATNSKLYEAAGFLGSNPLASKVFKVVTGRIGVTGWQVAKEVNEQPKAVEHALSELVRIEIVKADGQGLNAYYAPSGSAYVLRERIAS